MSRIFGFYANDEDRTWYDSSNVFYSKCIDKENELKTLNVVFKNGSQYQYSGVHVMDFLLFRDDLSQGKALKKYIKDKGYEYKKIEDADIQALQEELDFRKGGGIFVEYDGTDFMMKDNEDAVLLEKNEIELSDDAVKLVCEALSSVGKNVKLKTKD